MSRKSNKPTIPHNNRNTIALSQQLYSGPLPPPEALQKYEEIMPGFANRIMLMAEKEQDSRTQNEKTIINLEKTARVTGLIFAFIVAMTALVGGMLLLYTGHKLEGSIFSGIAVFWLVSAFIKGKKDIQKP